MLRLGISRLTLILFVGGLGLLGTFIILPILWACKCQSKDGQDFDRVRNLNNAMTLYCKKYNYYPCLTDMTSPFTKDITTARKNGGYPACLALKLLLDGGYIDDPKLFFSPRLERPDDHTLQAMSKDTDPRKSGVWACTYAYDPGHNPNQGTTIFFGNTHQIATQSEDHTAHALTCAWGAKELDPDSTGAYVINVGTPGSTPDISDDIYADNSTRLAWHDAFLQWDVPAKIP